MGRFGGGWADKQGEGSRWILMVSDISLSCGVFSPYRDEEIQSKCGVDAIIYLSYQRHLLVLTLLICVFSVSIILPVNFSGDLLGK